jgi:hypothetical protein
MRLGTLRLLHISLAWHFDILPTEADINALWVSIDTLLPDTGKLTAIHQTGY